MVSSLYGLVRIALCALVPLVSACVLFLLEYRTQYAARYIGQYLMQQNSNRQPRGALWQGILASRQTRMALSDSLAEAPLEPSQTPLPVLQNHYQLQYHGTHAAFFAVAQRDTALQPDLLSPENLRELAYSLQIYEQGRSLLTQAIVPDHGSYLRALVGAQIALEDGSLFYQLHKCLLAKDEPEAWTFLKMKEEDMAYWREHLAPLLGPDPERAQSDAGPILTAALAEVVQARADSLRQGETKHLLTAWDSADGFELRLTRTGDEDQFAAYALVPGQEATALVLPAESVQQHLGLEEQ
ncbi:MAG: hypothetical protein F4105_10105 [Gemmatimonadetes bacterium]|nr:hypothetical protein [Gemmatimonadota bacterium]